MKYKILIVEDQALTRQLVEMVLAKNEEYEIVGSIPDASHAITYCYKYNVDLVLMDVVTKNGSSGLDASEAIKRQFPKVKIMLVTSMPECSFIDRAKAIGIESFYYKDDTENKLEDILARTLKGESIYPKDTPMVNIGIALSKDFTKKDIQLLRLLIEGDTDRQIAETLGLSIETVHSRVKEILSKTGFSTRTRLAVAVRESGFIINN